jgi:hypothetical protein
MNIARRLSLIVAACCLSGGGPMGRTALARTASEAPLTPLTQCEQAGIAAEQDGGLPAGLLLAIGRVESGRWDDASGRVTAWPWTINAAGKGLWFDTRDAAAATVRTLLDGGTRSIDVGCFQINLLWHKDAFASLEQAFDPAANARYAAGFLLSLLSRTGSWEAAVEAYHSADPTLGFAYRQQVFSSWLAAAPIDRPMHAGPVPMLASASQLKPPAMPAVFAGVAVWTPMPIGAASGVVAMPAAAQTVLPVSPTTPPLPVVSYRVMPPGLNLR